MKPALLFLALSGMAWGQTTYENCKSTNVGVTCPSDMPGCFVMKCSAKPDPIDVPAIMHQPIDVKFWAECPRDYAVATGTLKSGGYSCLPPKPATCTDTARILMHDEAEPPRYWCHKVQTE